MRSMYRIVLILLSLTVAPAVATAKRCDRSAPGEICYTNSAGGPGGGYFRAACPAGHYLSSFKARAGAHIDQITPGCAPFGASYDATNTKYLKARGGPGGSTLSASCIGQVKAINVNTTTLHGHKRFVRSIELICNQGAAERRTACVGYYGDSGVTCQPKREDVREFRSCPDDMIAVGIDGASGIYLDWVALLCGPKPVAAEAKRSRREIYQKLKEHR